MSAQDEEPGEAEVIAHLAFVAGKVALRIAEAAFPEGPQREAAAHAASEVLLDDEGARELLGAAFAEGRADALKAAIASGKVPGAAFDWSDIESPGERKMIAREDSACSSCIKSDVCGVAKASQDLLIVISRCSAFSG